MGTTQSKKRRKDVTTTMTTTTMPKKKRGSVSYSDSIMLPPPRSASMDVLHHHRHQDGGITTTGSISSSTDNHCPLCLPSSFESSDCRFTASWSSDQEQQTRSPPSTNYEQLLCSTHYAKLVGRGHNSHSHLKLPHQLELGGGNGRGGPLLDNKALAAAADDDDDDDDDDGFDSCPDCLQLQTRIMSKFPPLSLSSSPSSPSFQHRRRHYNLLHHYHHLHHQQQQYQQQQRHHQLCEISNQDYDEMSTMSLNRNMSGRQSGSGHDNRLVDCNSNKNSNNINNNDGIKNAGRSGGIVQSKSVEFGDFGRGEEDFGRRYGQCNHNRAKENVNPVFCNNHSSRISTSENRVISAADEEDSNYRASTTGQSALSSSYTNSAKQGDVVGQIVCGHQHSLTRNNHCSSFPVVIDNNNSSKETMKKSNVSLLEDEEEVKSRWVHRKQMAQELRTLRMHLQREEDMRLQNESTSSSSQTVSPTRHNNHPYPSQTKEAGNNAVNESFTPTTNQSSVNNKPITITTSLNNKYSVSRNSSFNSGANTNTNTKATDAAISSSASTINNSTSSTTTVVSSASRRSIRSKFSKRSNYRYLDNHPVMTRLQNEQNNRLEMMERRIEGIRISAMQEAERRRFAEIFPAKEDDSETQKLLREARESLERIKEEKRKKTDQQQQHQKQQDYHEHLWHRYQFRASSAPPRADWTSEDDTHEDAGEIIPVVHVLSSSRDTTVISRGNRNKKKTITVLEKSNRNNTKSIWGQSDWPDINLGKPLTWLWLPFMLFPLVLRMLLSMLFNATATPPTAAPASRNGNSATPNTRRCSSLAERNILPRDKRKKSC